MPNKSWSPYSRNNGKHTVCKHIFKSFHVWLGPLIVVMVPGNRLSPELLLCSSLSHAAFPQKTNHAFQAPNITTVEETDLEEEKTSLGILKKCNVGRTFFL